MKKIIDGFNNLDRSIKRTIIGGIIVVIIVVIVVFILGSLNKGKVSYAKLEDKIKSAAISYYDKYPEKLPQVDGGEVNVDLEKLINAGLIKELVNYTDDECDANVYVQKNEEYIYSVQLICGQYSTPVIGDHILKNNKIVTKGDGLYKYNDEYIYRGDSVNNYIEFSGNLWRILRINNDGSIRIILNTAFDDVEWDDRYNIEKDDYVGINDFEVSRIKDYLIEYTNDTEYLSKDNKKWLVPKKVCLDKKSDIDFSNITSIECKNYSEESYIFSLIQLEEYYAASLDSNCNMIDSPSCTNYNYLSKGSFWTITPSNNDSSLVYTTGYSTSLSNANETYPVLFVTTLSKHALYNDGDGSYDNPYTIQE